MDRMMLKRLLALTAALLLCASCALAAGLPDSQGAVTDLAGVISADTAADIRALSERYKTATGGELTVVTRHFLGGREAKEYAEELFKHFNLTERSALLLMVIGEDGYALALGEKALKTLPKEAQDTLLSSKFRAEYLNRSYDAALRALLPELAQKLDTDGKLSVTGLFGQSEAAPAPTQAPTVKTDVFSWEGLFSSSVSDAQEKGETKSDSDFKNWYQKEEKNTGFSFWQLVVIALILYTLFGKKGKEKGGCGCGPLGWILSTLGIANLFGLRKK